MGYEREREGVYLSNLAIVLAAISFAVAVDTIDALFPDGPSETYEDPDAAGVPSPYK